LANLDASSYAILQASSSFANFDASSSLANFYASFSLANFYASSFGSKIDQISLDIGSSLGFFIFN
jgi:hypothetical protein